MTDYLRAGRASTSRSTSSASTRSATAARPASATAARCPSRWPRPSARATWWPRPCLSGNRNFEGRINPLVKANYLASPPLVVAYALAGTTDIDLTTEPLGTGSDGRPVYLQDIWPTHEEVAAAVAERVRPEMFRQRYAQRLRRRTRRGTRLPVAESELYRLGRRRARTSRSRRSWSTWPPSRGRSSRSAAPGCLAVLGDSVTTDHISPAGSIAADSPAGKYLQEHGVAAGRLQQLRRAPRQRSRDDARHVRQHPHPQPAGPRHRRRRHAAPARRPSRCRSTTRP